jgi:uncharacterized membrane protein YfcA
MNRAVIMICMSIGMTLGAFIPALWGDHDLLSGGSILWGLIGGLIGIWLGVKLSRQLGS